MTNISRNDVEALLRRAGLTLSPQQIDQAYAVWTMMEPMLERNRRRSECDDGEPAHIFRAEAYTYRPKPKDLS